MSRRKANWSLDVYLGGPLLWVKGTRDVHLNPRVSVLVPIATVTNSTDLVAYNGLNVSVVIRVISPK